MLISWGQKISISGMEGGPGAVRSLHIWIPLDRTILAVLSACQSDHASQSYANVYMFRQNLLLHRREGRRHRSTMFFTRTDSPQAILNQSQARFMQRQVYSNTPSLPSLVWHRSDFVRWLDKFVKSSFLCRVKSYNPVSIE